MENEMVVMSVTRMPPMGKLAVDALGARYESLAEVPDEAVRRMLTAAIAELVVFAGGYDKLVQAGLAPPLAGESSSPVTLEERQAAFESAMQGQMQELLVQAPVAPDVRTATDKPLSIPDQINPLIEKHLAANAELAGRSVKLDQDLHGNLSVICDGKSYERPELIEDVAVRNAVRAALSEWDRT
jgi:predicted transcriptional regulator